MGHHQRSERALSSSGVQYSDARLGNELVTSGRGPRVSLLLGPANARQAQLPELQELHDVNVTPELMRLPRLPSLAEQNQ